MKEEKPMERFIALSRYLIAAVKSFVRIQNKPVITAKNQRRTYKMN
jgi:hypothetical protein